MEKLILPVVALPRLTVLPNTNMHFDTNDQGIIAAVRCAEESSNTLFLAANTGDVSVGNLLYGTVGAIKNTLKLAGNRLKVLFEGNRRGRIESIVSENPLMAEVSFPEYENYDSEDAKAGYLYLKGLLPTLFAYQNNIPQEIKEVLKNIAEPNALVNMLAHLLETADKIEILKENDTVKRLFITGVAMKEEIKILEYRQEFGRKVEKNMRQMERDAVLRAQIRSLEEQLGEEDDLSDSERKIEELDASEEVKTKLSKEVAKLGKLAPNSQEAGLIESYLDWALSLPWGKKSEDILDLKRAKKALDEDHYGLDEVKDRILEYLAVRILSPDAGKSTILCLVGPPGVGKTSVARSIARALGKKYVKMSLGGVKDESEIRGHRKTYIGAMAGRILSNIANAGVSNPLFLLDEIDKLSTDMRGDPSSALLEVLDPAQNANFRDNYLEIPYDLSDVTFIATANSLSGIQRPLLDRMEIIEMSGYTREEKLGIAKHYLIKKQCENNGIKDGCLSFTDDALIDIIDDYTRESGVRELERKIGAAARKCARKFVEESDTIKSIVVGRENLKEYLGKPRYRTGAVAKNEIGAATGLAWTEVGGETLKIEVSLIKGKGGLMLTGKLGEVMQESAKTALSYVRANAEKFGIDEKIFEEHDIHIHVPEGATPKDGPSAGVTIATAILSALTGRLVKNTVAMTGEITLHGSVLPIGGLKEKTLAAIRNGLDTVIVPVDNMADAEEIPVEEGFSFVFAENVTDVFAAALENSNFKNRCADENRGACRA